MGAPDLAMVLQADIYIYQIYIHIHMSRGGRSFFPVRVDPLVVPMSAPSGQISPADHASIRRQSVELDGSARHPASDVVEHHCVAVMRRPWVEQPPPVRGSQRWRASPVASTQ